MSHVSAASVAILTCAGDRLVAELDHARRDEDAPTRERAEHLERGREAIGVGAEGVVDDGDGVVAHDLEPVLDRREQRESGCEWRSGRRRARGRRRPRARS